MKNRIDIGHEYEGVNCQSRDVLFYAGEQNQKIPLKM